MTTYAPDLETDPELLEFAHRSGRYLARHGLGPIDIATALTAQVGVGPDTASAIAGVAWRERHGDHQLLAA